MSTSTANAPLPEPVVPDALKVSPNETLSFAFKGRGVEIYEWLPKKDAPSQYEWVLKAPEADLFDFQGKKIGCHYAGPVWESNDGSKVTCVIKVHVAKDDSAAPWLLLSAKTHEGQGVMSPVTSIQRLETTGGRAPSAGTGQEKPGQVLRVPYTATYYFYVSKP